MIIAVVGLARSGKDTFSEMISNKYGFQHLDFSGDLLMPEAKKRGIKPLKSNLSALANELRKEHGIEWFAKSIMEKAESDKLVISGFRAPEEIGYIKLSDQNVIIVEVYADLDMRFNRKSKEDPETLEEFKARDSTDIQEKGLRDVLDMAQYRISTDQGPDGLDAIIEDFANLIGIIDYKSLGLKVGLEFHQRLDTHKLFCDCPAELIEEDMFMEFQRRLRPVAGELGKIDPAARQEFLRNKTFNYRLSPSNTCLVEIDSEPPHQINTEALDIALEVALMLDCDVVDEIHVMRKTVIDGSNTSGFQRTAMIAHQGVLKTPYADVPIGGIFLEEEAAGIVGESEGVKMYRLDRLGIPLVEIATGIMEMTPAQVREVALKLGTLLRVTGKVQRGLGTIRQDVNISIMEGDRIEVKGLQEIRILDTVIELEVMRQKRLIELKKEMQERKLKQLPLELHDFTGHFRKTSQKFIKKAIEEKGRVKGIILPGFAGLIGFELTPGRRFGTELAGRAKAFGLGGIIHTDEDLKKYGIVNEVAEISNDKKLTDHDTMIFVAGDNHQCDRALWSIIERVNYAFIGVPRETRKPLPDGNTDYLRPLPGASRLYPETDIKPVAVDKERLKELRKSLPKSPEQILSKLIHDYHLSEELAAPLVTSKHARVFYEVCDSVQVSPTLVASTLLNTLISLRREGCLIENLKPKHFKDLFKRYEKGLVSKEAIPAVLKVWSQQPSKSLESVMAESGAAVVSEAEIRGKAKQLIKQKKELLEDKRFAFKALMGLLMKEYRGKADGELISRILKEEIK